MDGKAPFQGPLQTAPVGAPGPARVRPGPKAGELAIAAIVLSFCVAGPIAAAAAGASTLLLAGILVMAVTVGAAAMLLPFRARIAERRLGQVDLVLDRAVASPGETIRVAFAGWPDWVAVKPVVVWPLATTTKETLPA